MKTWDPDKDGNPYEWIVKNADEARDERYRRTHFQPGDKPWTRKTDDQRHQRQEVRQQNGHQT